jgi:hypothetical protein
MKKFSYFNVLSGIIVIFFFTSISYGLSDVFKENIYYPIIFSVNSLCFTYTSEGHKLRFFR